MPSHSHPSAGYLPHRSPLSPLVCGHQYPSTMKGNDVSPAARSSNSTTTQPTICKRLNPDTSGVVENENAPLALHNKRQRTKSGSETMESVGAFTESAITTTDCCSGTSSNNGRGEATPLGERNVRTSRLEGSQEGVSSSCLETTSCSCVWDNNSDNLNSFISSDLTRNNVTRECRCKGQNILESSDNNLVMGEYPEHRRLLPTADGGLSPHCAATLEYVTKLPEGCSGGVSASDNVLNSKNLTSDFDDLEDDDNYLDSSEEEVEDEYTLLNNDDDESCGEDDQSVISSVTVGSTCSLRSVASEALNTVCINEHGVAANEDGSLLYTEVPAETPLPFLSPSMFAHVPPSIRFCQYNEKSQEMPLEISRFLKWRFTNITPLIVRKSIINSGFKITKKTVQWLGTWGKHMKSPCFKTVRDFQKVNHFPGTFQIGRKDKLWKNFVKLQTKFGKEEFGFIPKTFVLPGDMNALKTAFDKEGVKKKWIVKPPASARGSGIQVIHKWSQVPTDSALVVQRYISRPYLINDTKFDMRLYVLVTSFHPLKIYLYQDGLVRFASVQYNNLSASLGDRYMHLTNYSVNKSSSSYTHNVDAGQCQGHKWTIKSLWGYLKAKDVDTSALWSRIADLVIKTIISGENDIIIRTRKNVRSRYSCHELFGFDVIIDEKLRPWLLEVNISPSLHSASPLDHSVKGPLIVDLLNMVSFHIPDKISQQRQTELLKEFNLGEDISGLCLDRRLYTRLLTPDEQQKHIKVNTLPRSQYLTSCVESLTPDDIRHLILAEDELARAGKFSRIFPTAETYPYFGFIEKPRYYNRLMDTWENAYSSCRDKGIDHLQDLCKKKLHLKVPHSFKMPKVTQTGSSKVVSRLQHSLPQEKSILLQASSSHQQLSLKSQSAQQPTKVKKKAVPRSRLRNLKLTVNPLKPAMTSKLLLARGVVAGRECEIEDEEEDYEEEEKQGIIADNPLSEDGTGLLASVSNNGNFAHHNPVLEENTGQKEAEQLVKGFGNNEMVHCDNKFIKSHNNNSVEIIDGDAQESRPGNEITISNIGPELSDGELELLNISNVEIKSPIKEMDYKESRNMDQELRAKSSHSCNLFDTNVQGKETVHKEEMDV